MLFLYVIFFLILFFGNYKKNGFTASSFLLLVYLTSSVMGVVLMYWYDSYDEDKISIYAVIFHIICLYLFLKPILTFGNISLNNVVLPNYSVIRPLIWLIISLSIVTLFVSFPKMVEAFSYDDLSQARRLHYKGELFDDSSDKSILTYLGSIGQNFSFFALFFLFYVYLIYPKKKTVQILLLISSFGIVVSNLAIMGRDGVIRWILFFLFFFFLFKERISPKMKRKIYVLGTISMLPVIVVFLFISTSRFSGRSEHGILYYFIDYIGQQNVYFSYNFHQFMDGTSGGRMNFSYLFPASERASINNLNDYYMAEYNLNTFSTFIGSFYFDMGLITTFIIALLFYLVFSLYFRVNRAISFQKLFVFIILYQIVLLGIFYYMFYSPTVINTLISILFILYILQFNNKYKNRMV